LFYSISYFSLMATGMWHGWPKVFIVKLRKNSFDLLSEFVVLLQS